MPTFIRQAFSLESVPKKVMGILQSPPSVRPSRHLLLNHSTKSNQIWCVSYSHEWCYVGLHLVDGLGRAGAFRGSRPKHSGTKHPMPFFDTKDKISHKDLPPCTKHPMLYLSPRTKHLMLFLSYDITFDLLAPPQGPRGQGPKMM